jgi:hypothetical protein
MLSGRPPRTTSYRRPATSPFAASPQAPVPQFEVGDRVHDDAHGLGWVTAVEDTVAVTVDFGTASVRIASPYRKLTKL